MGTRHWATGFLVCGIALAGCQQRDEIKQETQDLREARANTGKVASELEGQLNQAKAEVVRLEKELALAKQGLTSDVREQQAELKAAMDRQDKEIRREVEEVQKVAGSHDSDTEQAAKELKQVPAPGRVDAHVDSGATVEPGEQKLDVKKERIEIPIERSRVEEKADTEAADQQPPAPPEPGQNPPATEP